MSALHNQPLMNRYPGVKPFSENDLELFFGREKDLEAFSSLLYIKQTVVLYSKSGYGKSSLINAGIIPHLKQKETWVYFYVRFNYYSAKDPEQNVFPVQTIKQRFSEHIKIDQDSEFYKLIPDENSLWYWIKMNQLSNPEANFIILFDQFEELFNYPKEQIDEFSDELSQLLYNNVPLKYRKKILELDEAEGISDDFNEFLYDKPELKVVFSIRSDRMSQMNSLTNRHPLILQNHYELEALEIEDARNAIIEPARVMAKHAFKTPPFTYTEAAVELILKGVSNPYDGKIETPALQIVCRYIEDMLVADKKNVVISEENIGDVTDIFQNYYGNILKTLSNDDRVNAQRLIEDELIDDGRRNPLSENYIKNKLKISEELLFKLETSSLLRRERDAEGRMLIELGHDRLVAPITAAREKRVVLENETRIKNEYERKRRLDEEVHFLQKSRELDRLDKEMFNIKKSETLKTDFRIFTIRGKQLLMSQNLKTGFAVLSGAFIILVLLVWAGIAFYSSVKETRALANQVELMHQTNAEFKKVLSTMDSVASPVEYQKLKVLLKKYEDAKP